MPLKTKTSKIRPLTDKLPADIIEAFKVPLGQMRSIIKDFHSEMVKGLSGKRSSLKMIPGFVDKPTGRESGEFIALDLGGTNLRVLLIKLKRRGRISVRREKGFILRKAHTAGSSRELFDFIASAIKRFCEEQKFDVKKTVSMGFTFSFPVRQLGVAQGRLLSWTKEFSTRGVIGRDVVKLLQEALMRQGLENFKISALVNDTVGTLAAAAYADPRCDIGVILGTGTNACYRERTSRITKWRGKGSVGKWMIVNIEWGNFNKLRRTEYDRLLDASSSNPGEQVLEKMVSGMYLSEVAGIVITGLVSRGAISVHRGLRAFKRSNGFTSEDLSIIEADSSLNLSSVGSVLKRFGAGNSSLQDRRLIQDACNVVSRRASRISAAAVAAVVTKIDPGLSDEHTIAVDGSLYEKHPGFSINMRSALREIFGKKSSRINIVLSKDGSGRGAAVIAAIASNIKENGS